MNDSIKKEFAVAFGAKRAASKGKKGVDMSPKDLMEDDERAESIADAIMRKRKKMADGGEVEPDNMEPGNNFEEYDEEALEDPTYDDDQISAQPEDSNEDGEKMYSGSIADQIRKKLRSKL